MRTLEMTSHDPAYNLALEQYLFDNLQPEIQGYFLLWHSAPSVIVGRHQNTQCEINTDLVRQHALPVIRRMTGGGAVYHDMGNVNYSFIQSVTHKQPMTFTTFLEPIVDVLRQCGVPAICSGRNDIMVEGRKVSGSAQLRRGNALLQHGTLLVNVDLDMLGRVLMGDPDKLHSKGVASVRSRVANLSEFLPVGMGMERLKAILLQAFCTQRMSITAKMHAAVQALVMRRYCTWDWNYGASPRFTKRHRQRFPWGVVEYGFEVRHGIIECCRIFGDFFSHVDIEQLENVFLKIRYEEAALVDATACIAWESFFVGCDAHIMQRFFVHEVNT